jgi:chemotaxis signal transduction protein
MRPAPAKPQSLRTEQIILFRVSGQLFAISSASVQEVRSVDTLAGAAKEIPNTTIRKVRHVVQRGEHSLYVVNGALHFGLPPSPAALVFILRRTRTALLIDGIDRMTSMTRLQALPQAFCHEERDWYRGLTALDQDVVPVVKPEGFLTPDELLLLDSLLQSTGEVSTDSGRGAGANNVGAALQRDPAIAPNLSTNVNSMSANAGAAPFGFEGADFPQPNSGVSV